MTNDDAIKIKKNLLEGKLSEDNPALLETIKHLKNPTKISLKKLIVRDGSITLRCPKCNSTWIINYHEQEWIYEEEVHCRKCMKEHGSKTTASDPLVPVWVESTIGKKK